MAENGEDLTPYLMAEIQLQYKPNLRRQPELIEMAEIEATKNEHIGDDRCSPCKDKVQTPRTKVLPISSSPTDTPSALPRHKVSEPPAPSKIRSRKRKKMQIPTHCRKDWCNEATEALLDFITKKGLKYTRASSGKVPYRTVYVNAVKYLSEQPYLSGYGYSWLDVESQMRYLCDEYCKYGKKKGTLISFLKNGRRYLNWPPALPNPSSPSDSDVNYILFGCPMSPGTDEAPFPSKSLQTHVDDPIVQAPTEMQPQEPDIAVVISPNPISHLVPIQQPDTCLELPNTTEPIQPPASTKPFEARYRHTDADVTASLRKLNNTIDNAVVRLFSSLPTLSDLPSPDYQLIQEHHGELFLLLQHAFGTTGQELTALTARLSSLNLRTVTSVDPIRAIIAVAIYRWVLESDFPESCSKKNRCVLLRTLETEIERRGGKVAMENLLNDMLYIIIRDPSFFTTEVQPRAAELALRFSQTLNPLLAPPQNPILSAAPKVHEEWLKNLEKICAQSLELTAHLRLYPGRLEFYWPEPEVAFDSRRMTADSESSLRGRQEGVRVRFGLMMGILAHDEGDIMEDSETLEAVTRALVIVR